MKKILDMAAFIAMVFMCAVSVHASSGELIDFPVEGTEDYKGAYEAAELFNDERESLGLNRLTIDADLTEAAMQRAYELAVYTAHIRPNGTVAGYDSNDLSPKVDGENIGFGLVPTARAFKDGIMNSPGHRYWAMKEGYTITGIGHVHTEDGSFWVQLLGTGEPNTNLVMTEKVSRGRNVKVTPGNLKFHKYNGYRSDGGYSIIYGAEDTKPVRSRVAYEVSDGLVLGAIFPSNRLAFTSSDESVFTVDGSGKITPTGVGKATITYTLWENPSVSDTQIVEVAPYEFSVSNYLNSGKDSSSVMVAGDITYEYTGSEITPKVIVKDFSGNTLREGIDYIISSYKNNVSGDYAGIAKVYVTGMGNYTGMDVAEFKITKPVPTPSPAPVTTPEAEPVQTGKPAPTAEPSPKPSTTVKPAAPTPTKVPANNSTVNKVPKKFTLKLSRKSYIYNGKPHKPGVGVTVGKMKISKEYYTVSYKNNTKVGIATVTVKGKGKYKYYSASTSYKIVPKKQSITKLKGGKRQIHVYWKKDSQAQGYQIQCSTRKNFKSGRKTYESRKNKTTGGSIKNLKSKRTYYVRARSYRKVGGKYWYGPWSTVKKIKTK